MLLNSEINVADLLTEEKRTRVEPPFALERELSADQLKLAGERLKWFKEKVLWRSYFTLARDLQLLTDGNFELPKLTIDEGVSESHYMSALPYRNFYEYIPTLAAAALLDPDRYRYIVLDDCDKHRISACLKGIFESKQYTLFYKLVCELKYLLAVNPNVNAYLDYIDLEPLIEEVRNMLLFEFPAANVVLVGKLAELKVLFPARFAEIELPEMWREQIFGAVRSFCALKTACDKGCEEDNNRWEDAIPALLDLKIIDARRISFADGRVEFEMPEKSEVFDQRRKFLPLVKSLNL